MRVLVTGATGFIGRRLTARLLEDGIETRALVRDPESDDARELAGAGAELVRGDLTRPDGLERALSGVDTAYFLVHMIGDGDDYPAIERAAAARFARAASSAGVGRLIYLGGLGDGTGSRHLASRGETAEALAAEGPPLTYFRAAMVVGAGSESFELLRGIVELLPVMPVPDFLETETQPIGVDDVVSYLRAALDVPESAGREIQIGGPDVVTHREAIEAMARALGRRAPRAIPMSDEIARPRTVAAGAAALTSGSPQVAAELSFGLLEPTVVSDEAGAALFDIRPRSIDDVMSSAVEASREEDR